MRRAKNESTSRIRIHFSCISEETMSCVQEETTVEEVEEWIHSVAAMYLRGLFVMMVAVDQ